MKRSRTKTLKYTHITVGGLGMLCLSLIALYIYFLSSAVVHVVMRQEMQRQNTELHSTISSLEGEYIDAQHQVSDRIASLDGYVAIEDKIFINRTNSTVALNDTRFTE